MPEMNSSAEESPGLYFASFNGERELEMSTRPETSFTTSLLPDRDSFGSSNLTVSSVLWYSAFSGMLSLAILGNILIIWIVLAHRRMRTVTNYFLLNLSVADLTMATLNGVPNCIYMIQKEWIFGSVLCMVNNFVATLTVASCVFTMTAISIDRYLAIIRPLKPRMTKGLARRSIGGIWCGSILLALPSLIFSERVTYPSDNALAACILRWPDDKDPSQSNIDLAYNICLLLVTYALPMGAMAMCYGSMSRELWGQRQIGESVQRQGESIASKRKIVRMFIAIVTTFGICWFPYHGYFIYQYYDGTIVYKVWAQHLYLSFYWLAMSTSMINPLIYYLMNSRFRTHIRQVGSHCCCSSGRQSRRGPDDLVLGASREDENRRLNAPKSLLVTRNHLHFYHHPQNTQAGPSSDARWNGSGPQYNSRQPRPQSSVRTVGTTYC